MAKTKIIKEEPQFEVVLNKEEVRALMNIVNYLNVNNKIFSEMEVPTEYYYTIENVFSNVWDSIMDEIGLEYLDKFVEG